MDDGSIISYFKSHKLNGTGIRNFLMYTEGARDYVSSQLAIHPEYETPGGYITCLVKGITLPKCVVCGRTIHYRSYRNGHTHCSMKCFSKDAGVVDGRRRTMQERYGVSNPSQVDEFKDRRTATIRERYGVDSILRNSEFVRKQKKTMVERYGVDSWQKTDESKRGSYHKSYQTILGWKDYVVPLFTEEEYHGWKHGEVYKWRCVECGNEFESDLHVTDINGILRLPRCMNCHPFSLNESTGENEMRKFIELAYDGRIEIHDRKVLDGMELDCYLPDMKLAFEYDGLFFHDEFSYKGKSYHLDKTLGCMRKGVRLVHVFEDEWKSRRTIVEDRIRSIIGVGQKRLYARKCRVSEISPKESSAFLDENHLQGRDNSPVRYGLHHGGELVAVMTFCKPRFSKAYDWEMARFATKSGLRVVGGASKLLRAFESTHSGAVVSYADRRYSDGRLYERLGFEHVSDSEPNYWWYKGKSKLSRYQCQKHRLKDVLGDGFDPSKSESDNMRANGWKRIYDCGNMVFVKKCGDSLKKSENGSY